MCKDFLDAAKLGDRVHSVRSQRMDELVLVVLAKPLVFYRLMRSVREFISSGHRRQEIGDMIKKVPNEGYSGQDSGWKKNSKRIDLGNLQK